MVTSTEILVKRDSASYETSSYSSELVEFFIKFRKVSNCKFNFG